MNRFEVIVRQSRDGKLHQCTAEVVAQDSVKALRIGVAAMRMKGGFTAVVRPFGKGGNNHVA